MEDITYTIEQFNVALLQQQSGTLNQSLIRIESTMQSNFTTLLVLIMGIYGLFIGTALAKITGIV